MTNLKILFYDLETAPLLAHIWRPSDDYVTSDRLLHDSWIICWSAKWAHETKKVHVGMVTPQEAIDQDDSRIVGELSDLLREADIIVAHNGDRFDLPMFNGRLLMLGLEPLGPVQTIDTLKLARSNFRLAYNKLDYLAEQLGLGNKLKTGFDLWRDCYHGDQKALNKMSKYNVRDVILLEQVFNKLKPYVKGLKRLVEPDYDQQEACPFCGSSNVTRRGFARTQSATYQQYQCGDCRRYSRSRTAAEQPKFAIVPL